ncbi:MAG: DUF1559 domain-containing protein [Planctomycetes bacterium]|nr:DUF1559 domain-containing protein [Planctomycetota bacterium]
MSTGKPLLPRSAAIGLAALMLVGLGADVASAQNLRPEFAPIAKDDFGFFHFRVAELWTGEVGAKLREQFPEPADFLRRDLERSLGLDPAGVESVTFVLPTAASMRFLGFFSREDKIKQMPKEFKEDFKDEKKPFEERPKKEKCGEQPDKDDFKEKPGKFKEKEGFPFETDDRPREPMTLAIVTTLKPYDRDQVVRGYFRNEEPTEMKHNGKTYLQGKRAFTPALHFLNDRTLLAASSPAFMKKVLGRPWKTGDDGPLGPACDLAMKKHAIVFGLNLNEPVAQDIKKEARREWSEPWHREPMWAFVPLLEAQSITGAIDVGKTSKLQATVTFADGKQASAAIGPLQDALVLFRLFVVGRGIRELRRELEFTDRPLEMLLAVKLMQQLETALRGAKIEAKQANVLVTIQGSSDVAVLHALAKAELKALEKDEVFQAAKLRRQSVTNLKMIGLALHSYHDDNKLLPPAAICDKNGKPLLSWRVAILPYIEQGPLYREFQLDEAWDSPHNIKLLPKMPKVYAPVGLTTKQPHSTFYQAFVGSGTIFERRPDANAMLGAKGLRLLDCTDGTAHTIGVAEATNPIEWTRPVELEFGDKLPKVGGTLFKDGFHGMMMDASVFFFESRIDDGTLRAMITRAGGEFVDYYRFTRRR